MTTHIQEILTNNKNNLEHLYDTHQNSIFIGSAFLGFLLITYFSNNFQKKFSRESKPNKFIIFVISLFVFFVFSLIYLITSNILNLKSHKENNNQYLTKSEENINLFLICLNLLFYLIIPFAYFILIEEKNTSSNSENNNQYENLNQFELEKNYEKNIYNEIEAGINSVNFVENEFDNLRVFKNFCFYLIMLVSLNVIFLINYKIFSINTRKLIEIYSFIPEKMRVYSTFNSDVEFLLYINAFNIYLFFKIFSIFYIPYGLGKLISLQVDNMKNNVQVNFEYKKLNTNLSKNHEVIKQITTQKLMTGKNLTKKEKLILRMCKENNTHLEHKQEILEEKYSKLKIFLAYCFLPFKFVGILSSLILTIIIIFSKISACYSNIFQSNCGFYCGYFSDKIIASIGFEDIYENILSKNPEKILGIRTNLFIGIILLFISFYILLSIFYSLKNLGIFNPMKLFSSDFYSNNNTTNNSNNPNEFHNAFECQKPAENKGFLSINSIRNDKVLTFSVYVLFLIFSIFAIFEIFNMSNKISNFMENYNRCNLNSIDEKNCNFSHFMLIKMKNSFNFSMGMILVQVLEIFSIIMLIAFTVILPIKSMTSFFYEKEGNEYYGSSSGHQLDNMDN